MATAQVPDDTDQHQMATTQTDEEQEYISKAGWKILFNFTTRRHVPVILGGIVSTVIAALTMPVFAIIYGFIFGDFTSYGGGLIDSHTLMKDLAKYCVILVGTTVLNWIASSFFFFCFLTFGEMQARSARNKIFDALIKKDMVWFDTRETGVAALLPTVQAHIRNLQLAVSSPLGETLQGIIQALSALGVAFYLSWKLTLVVLSSIPLLYLALALVANGQSFRACEQSETLQFALKYITTAITSIETVKCFNGERYELNNFKRITGLAASLYKWVANFRSMQIGLVQFFTFTMFVQGFWYGKHLIDTGENRAADILTTFWAVLMVIAPVTQLMPQMVVLQKGKAAGASLSLLLKSMSGRDRQLESRGQTKPARCVGDIEFKNVTFSYPSRADEVAIRDASLSIPAGETTFIIGKSGSGKSTLGQLLVRFYQPSTGHILLDGTPLEDLDVQWLRRNVTLVEQHSVMFNDTIYGNVALGKPDEMVYMQDIHDAVKFAMLEKVVGGLPDGLGAELGIKGSSMSGGQKQRLALARAKIRDSPVLVLDESTSALDYITRATVYEALREWRKGKTTIIITHDISQIKADDFLYLLDDTRVVREGYRKELEAEGEGLLTFFQSSEEAEEAFSNAGAANYAEYDVDDRTGVNRRTLTVQIPPIVRPISSILFGQPVLESTFDKNSDTTAADTSANLTAAPRASHYEHRELRPQVRHSYAEGPESLQVPRKDQPPDLDDSLSKELGLRPDSLASQNFSWYGSNKHPMSFSKDLGSPTESTLSLPTSPISLYPQPLPIPDSLPERPKTIGRPHIRQRIRSGVRILRHKEEPDEIGTSNKSLPLREILMSVWPAIGWSSHMMAIGAIFFAMIHSACTPVFAMAFARLQSTYQTSSEQHNEARNYSLVILGVAVIDGLSMYLMFFLSDAVAQAWSLSLKTEAMRRILMQPREFFDKEENSTSRLAETLDHFAEEARNLPGRFSCIFLAIFSMVTISVLWSMAISWKLALVAIATGPILFGITKLSNTISNHWERVAGEADDKIGEILYETFVNIRTVRCLGLENHFRKKYQAATKDAVKVGVKRAAYSGSVYGMAFSSVQFVATLLYWYGGVLMANKELTASTVIECFLILMLSVNHVCSMAQYITQVNISRDAGTRLLRLARLPIDSHELTGTTKFDSIGDISFKNVNFTYPTRKDVPVLNDVTFSIPTGSCTAIVGSSGSGKSTVASLLLKLYQADMTTTTTPSSHPTSGIHISNHPITTLSTSHLRNHIALVPQTPILFPGTITQNITYGLSPSLPETSISSVRAAAKAAGISDFIESLPQAYNTLVGEGGTGLSGGQAQRLAIARALVRKPDVLVLDEATSALDGVAAGVIRETILGLVGSGRGGKDGGGEGEAEREKKKMTVIIITHAREMMVIAEHVVMLDQGRVVEQGSFQELKRRPGSAFGKLLRGETA